MKTLVVGANGYLGSYLAKQLSCDTWVREKRWPDTAYDYVINCVGIGDLEYCERHRVESYSSNVKFVIDLANRYSDSKLIHFSSYYVYDSPIPSNEDSKTTRKYVYCSDKLDSEKIVVDRDGLVFRLGKLFGNPYARERKLTDYLIRHGQNGGKVVVDNQIFNPTSVHQVYEAILSELWNGSLFGRRNVACEEAASHYSYAREIRKYLPKLRLKRIDRLPRMFHNYGRFEMDLSRIRSEITLNPWKRDLQNYLSDIGVANA